MADTTQFPINGNYAGQHAYPDAYSHVQAGADNTPANFQLAQSSVPPNAPTSEQKSDISKDEVGWFFVERYYTTMSRNPEKLQLFYSRRSQFVFGTEAESVPVAVGQKAINECIKQLGFQDCKVRVLNVDSQASFDNILVSVIGEISNKSEPSRKFVQTFVLAEQPNGYYVLNDIFRYLADEEEELPVEEAPPAEGVTETAPAEPQQPAVEAIPADPVLADPEAQVNNEAAVEEVDDKLKEAQMNEPQMNGEELHQFDESATQVNGENVAAEASAAAIAEPEVFPAEKPASPAPTPAEPAKETPASESTLVPAPAPTSTPAAAPATPAIPETAPSAVPEKELAPTKTVPKTWANIASKSGASVPIPAIPVAPIKPVPTPSAQAVAIPVAAAPASVPESASAATPSPAPVATPALVASETLPNQESSNDNAGWQTAGVDHKKTQSRAADDQNVLAYIKNVNEKVDASLLRQTLSRFGKLKFFDVSRQKNCAFVEFADPASYAAAVAANPHQIGSEQIVVEERRARGSAYSGNANFGAGRGGAGRGRGDRPGGQGRSNFQRDGARGGFAPRGRGGNLTPKGRSQAQTA